MTTPTAFTTLVGCRVPIQQAPMGNGIASPGLIRAVTAAGAMGMLTMAGAPARLLGRAIDELDAAGAVPFGVSFLVPYVDVAAVDEVLARGRLVDFYHGPPDRALVERAHDAGALVEWQVGFLDDAVAAADLGVDLLVLRGVEGGGRLHGDRPLRALLDEVVARVDAPVLAAGGIGTRADVVAALEAGAAGVRIGTRLVATVESGAHPAYKQAVVDAGDGATVVTEAFSAMWPTPDHPPARVLRSSLAAAEAWPQGTAVGEVVIGRTAVALPRFSVIPPNTVTTGAVEAMALYAGEAVRDVPAVESAGAVIAELAPVAVP